MTALRRLPLASALLTCALLGALSHAHGQGVPGTAKNKCLAGKTKCLNAKVAGLLKCRAQCQSNPKACGASQTSCEAKVIAKFDGGATPAKGCVAKLEAKSIPGAKPENLCTTTGDTAALEGQADALVADIVARLEGSPPAICGDGVKSGNESCDLLDLGSADCASLGFASGVLICTAGCGYDVGWCTGNPASTCGNGTIESPESCDQSALGGVTCQTLGYAPGGALACTPGCGYDVGACFPPALPSTGQTTCFDGAGTAIPCAGTGQDGEVQAGAPLAYQDNGDGTITDLNTTLVWEKKALDASLHDVGNCYPWFGFCSGDNVTTCLRDADCAAGVGGTCGVSDCQVGAPNGRTIFQWVDAVNAETFGGHSDWRIPNVRELQSMFKYGSANPAVSAVFDTGCVSTCTVTTCSCPTTGPLWTSTTNAGDTTQAWFAFSQSGAFDRHPKITVQYVRAVRGGRVSQ